MTDSISQTAPRALSLAISLRRVGLKITLSGLSALAILASVASTATSAAADGFVARHGMSGAQYQTAFDTYTAKGYRLSDVSSYTVHGTPYYAAIWKKQGGGAWVTRHGMGPKRYQSQFDTYTAQGYAPAFLDAMSTPKGPRFAAQWTKGGKGAWVARHGLSSSAYQGEFDKWVGKGYRLVDVAGYSQNGQAMYSAIWKKQGGGAWVARHDMSPAQYQTAFDKWTAQGYRPVHVDGFDVNGKTKFAAIWVKQSGAYVARHGLSGAQYQAEFDKWAAKGYTLHDISGYGTPNGARYAAIWTK